ncbi:MAG: serine/threonine-protein kinase [Candidatus Promineifilaceae bacterium]|nr:serine/threonine-protein kinase [Candidatus Promineifilaceae bacterium]
MSSAVHTSNTILRQRYRLTNIVGQGGMGHVYRAEDLRLPGRLCAIKSLPPDPLATKEMREQAHKQFLKEASILAQLDHPNLPKVSDFFSEGDFDYLVMDYVPGKDLQQLLDESRASGQMLEEETVLSWSEQIIDALAYLHKQNPPVLHRDIKPSNIKLTPDHRIKLVDFGLVKILAAEEAQTITVVQGKGTIMYTPLEQYGGEGGHTDARTDIYALGATLYTLLTAVPPAHAKARFLNPNVLSPPKSINPVLSRRTSDAVMWAMEMHPDQRPRSVREFQDVLTGKIRRPDSTSQQPTSASMGDVIRSNWIAGIIALGLLIVAILLTVL